MKELGKFNEGEQMIDLDLCNIYDLLEHADNFNLDLEEHEYDN